MEGKKHGKSWKSPKNTENKRYRKTSEFIRKCLKTHENTENRGKWWITIDEYDKLVARFRSEEQDIHEETREASSQDNDFLDSSLMILELSQNAHEYFSGASESKKQKILNLVTSNLQLKNGMLVYDLREPFDALLNLSKTKGWLPAFFLPPNHAGLHKKQETLCYTTIKSH